MSSDLENNERDYTLVFCRRTLDNGRREILLGMKKRGFGAGKWNGFGGKVEANESIEEAAARELLEESGLVSRDLSRCGFLVFRFAETGKVMRVHVYESWAFDGEPSESEEMRPRWFAEDELPFDKMWADDQHWFPFLLSQKKFIGRCEFEDEETITSYDIREAQF